MKKSKKYRGLADEVRETHGELGRAEEARELIAKLAQQDQKHTLVQRVITAIRKFLRKHFGAGLRMNDAEVMELIREARSFVVAGVSDKEGGSGAPLMTGRAKSFSEEEQLIATKTSRVLGSVGKKAVVPRYVVSTVKSGETVLNFGAGKVDKEGRIPLADTVTEAGAVVTNYDFPANSTAGVHDPEALSRVYDTVMASNVLNVASSEDMLDRTLEQLKQTVAPGGRLVANFPASPRKSDVSPAMLREKLEVLFGDVERVSGTPSVPVFEARRKPMFSKRQDKPKSEKVGERVSPTRVAADHGGFIDLQELFKALDNSKTVQAAMPHLKKLAEGTYEAGMKFKDFSSRMRDRLMGLWNRFKKKMYELFQYAKETYKKSRLGSEVGAITISKGQDKKPKKKLDKKAEKEAKEEAVTLFSELPTGRKVTYSEKKVLKMKERYKDLVQTLRDSQTDTYRKQLELTKYIRKTLPLSERGRVITEIKNLAKPKTVKTRAKYFEKALVKIDQAWERYEVKQISKKVKSLIKNAKPSKKKGYPEGKFIPEVQKEIDKIKAALAMDKAEATEETVKIFESINDDADGRDATEEEASRLYYLSFPLLDSLKLDRAKTVLNEVVQLLEEGKIIHALREGNRRAKMAMEREFAFEDFTGGKGLKDREVILSETARRQKTFRGLPRRIADALSKFDTIHQNFTWLLDKASRLHRESGTLRGHTTEHFGRLAHNATHTENTQLIKHYKLFENKLSEIYDKKGLPLKRALNKNTQIVEDSGVKYTDSKGERRTLPLSQNQAYKLWQWLMDPTLAGSFEANGYTSKTKEELEIFMDPEVREWAEWQLEEFYPEYYNGINEVYGKMFYVDLPFNPNYTPLVREYEGKGSDSDDPLLQNKNHYGTVMTGHHKNRVETTRPPKIMDGDQILLQHVVEMEHFKAWAEPIREMRSVLGSEEIQTALRHYNQGNGINNVLNTFINNFASSGVDRSMQLSLLDSARSNFVASVLGMNVVVLLKQLTSVPAYAMDIPARAWAKGLVHFASHPVTAVKTLSQSNMMQSRYGIGFERDIVFALKRGAQTRLSGSSTWSDLMMTMTKIGDKSAILAGGWSVYQYHLKKNLSAGKSQVEAHREALVKFEEATELTQQAAGIKDLGKIQQAYGSFGKLFTMFMTSPSSYYRQISGGYRNLFAGRGSHKENMKRIAITQFILPSIFQFVASGMRWDDDDQLRAILLGPVNGLFVLRDLLGAGIYAFTEGRAPYATGLTPFSSVITSIGRLGKEFGDIIENGKITIDDMIGVADEMLKGPAKLLTKIPYDPVKRMIEGVADSASGKTEYPLRRSIGYSERALKPDKEKQKSRRRLYEYQ